MSSIDVVIRPEPGDWWQVVAALTPLAWSMALVFVVLPFYRSMAAPAAGSGRRAEWWSRAEWALDLALDDRPERRKAGLALLEQLSVNRYVGKEDAHLVAQVRELLSEDP